MGRAIDIDNTLAVIQISLEKITERLDLVEGAVNDLLESSTKKRNIDLNKELDEHERKIREENSAHVKKSKKTRKKAVAST